MDIDNSADSENDTVRKILLTALGLLFIFLGSLFVKQRGQYLQDAKAMQAWEKTTCTIVSCKTENAGQDFRLALSYRYKVDRKTYTSERYRLRKDCTKNTIGEIKEAQAKLRTGKQVDCFYNPEDPTQAVLIHSSPEAEWFIIGVILLLPAFGLLLATLPWIRRRKKKTVVEETSPRNIRISLIIFGLIFTLIGLAILKPITITPLKQTLDARSWISIPAQVVSSKVKSSSGNGSTIYSAYVAYRYMFQDAEYFGDRLNLCKITDDAYDPNAETVRQYPVGRKINVFVNPSNPTESTIDRKPSLSLLLGLFPLPFLAFGLFLMGWGLRRQTNHLDMTQSREQIVELKIPSKKMKVVGYTIVALIPLGIAVILGLSHLPLRLPIMIGIIGVVLLGQALYVILSLFNPKPSIELTPGNIHPGTNVAMRWHISGRTDRIRSLSFTLRCIQVVTETKRSVGSSNTQTVEKPLFEKEIYHTENQVEIEQGTCQFLIPAELPSSQPGDFKGIRWALSLHADIPHWPDIKAELPFIVYPND